MIYFVRPSIEFLKDTPFSSIKTERTQNKFILCEHMRFTNCAMPLERTQTKFKSLNLAPVCSKNCKASNTFRVFASMLIVLIFLCMIACNMCACANSTQNSSSNAQAVGSQNSSSTNNNEQTFASAVSDKVLSDEQRAQREAQIQQELEEAKKAEEAAKKEETVATLGDANVLRAGLNLSEDYRASFVHGNKPASCQKYIMLHDTEGNNDAESVISSWDGAGSGVAAHFIVNKDGSIYQCVPLDKIAHHAGFGNTGNNASFDVSDESRDDKVGTVSIGASYADYGMNSYSVGIEIVHVGGSGDYPEAQLTALDNLIAYIDAYYGFQAQITDHKAWRSTNSDTSEEFSIYLANYKANRKH